MSNFVARPGSRGFDSLTPRAEVLVVARLDAGFLASLVGSSTTRASLCGTPPDLVKADDSPLAADFLRTGIGMVSHGADRKDPIVPDSILADEVDDGKDGQRALPRYESLNENLQESKVRWQRQQRRQASAKLKDAT